MDSWLILNAVGCAYKLVLKKLIDFFGHPDNILRASEQELMSSGLVDAGFIKALGLAKKSFDLEKEQALMDKHGVRLITLEDDKYPLSLRYLPDAPIVLYVQGEVRRQDMVAIGVVGTRNFTTYGRAQATTLSGQLAEAGVTIVSGLARGIDTFAHRAALDKGGRTIGILGGGIDCFFPAENRELAKRISASGAVISEYTMAEHPSKVTFPLRNRIISGLSLGTVVIEADEKSGALITARWATAQGREVFAVPGNISSRYSRGTNGLIRDGAKLVETSQDIIEEINCLQGLSRRRKKPVQQDLEIELDEHEDVIFKLIGQEPVNIESLLQKTGLPLGRLSPLLLQLEMKDLIQELGGKNYIRV
jgi:DNA processing protein